jgi:hypothetical protein
VSLSQTLVIEPEDEPTIVDRRSKQLAEASLETQLVDPAKLLRTELPRGGSPTPLRDSAHVDPKNRFRRCEAWATRIVGWRPTPGGVALLVSIGVLGVWALRQHHEARRLQALMDDLRRARDDAPAARAPESTPASPTAPIDPTRPQRQPEPPGADRAALERRGAELLGANDHTAALAHYRALTKAFPEERVFADVVEVLEFKRGCSGPGAEARWGCR